MRIYALSLLVGLLTQGVSALKVGDEVSVDALSELKFLQGEAPTEWEEGKVYIFEFWATWCGPCIQVIPHMDALYDEYHEKGLEVFGMNVKEADQIEKLESFLEKQGDGMSYPIGLMEKDDAFDQAYYSAAGIRGIPHALIVKGGKLVLAMHPGQLDEEMVEKLLSPDTDLEALMMEQKEMQEKQNKAAALYQNFMTAKKAENVEEMKKLTAEAKPLNPKIYQYFNSQVLITEKNWEGLQSFIQSLPEKEQAQAGMSVFVETDTEENVDAGLLQFLEPHLQAEGSLNMILNSRLQTRLGENEKALEVAKAALAEAEKAGDAPTEPFMEYIKKLEEGTPLTLRQFSGLMRSASKNAQK